MGRARRSRWSREDGFTMIELLVVMIILAILAALAISVWLGQREKAQRSSAISSLRNVSTLVSAHFTDMDEYPDRDTLEVESRSYTFVAATSRSTGETVVSTGFVNDDPDEGLVLAAAGGGSCYYVRFGSTPDIRFEHKAPLEGSTDCSADEFYSITPGSGW